jgi:hypothetical protein
LLTCGLLKTVFLHHQLQKTSELLPSRTPPTTNAGEDVGKKEPSYTAGGCKLVQPLWKTIWRLLKKLKIEFKCECHQEKMK